MKMLSSDSRPPLVVILGPTAVGKTEISLQLAERLMGEIVSADSRLFYRGMDIGTAKPTPAEQQRVPHHLVDIADPDQVLSLAQFQAYACKAIADIHQRRRLPFLVGGTGQYLRAVTEGWLPPAVQPSPKLRLALEAWVEEIGKEGLHDRLASLDPPAAKIIDPRNLRRTIRALEVIFITGQRFSDQRQRSDTPYHLLQIGLQRPREELYARVDARIDAMLAAGLVDEVRRLLMMGYSTDLASFSAIGYREVGAYLSGVISLNEAVTRMKRVTRTFVRRQTNWFKVSDPQIHWFNVDHTVIDKIESFIRSWIGDR